MSNGHAPFPPSAAERWMTCTGSFALGLQAPPEVESEYAREGTRLHTVAADWLKGATPALKTADDFYVLKPYMDYATKVKAKADWVRIEEWIDHSPLLSGTPDLLAMYSRLDMLEVVDLKNGAGIMVDPVENRQLLSYGYMALKKMQAAGMALPKKVRLTVVQPPDEDKPVKSWDTTAERVLEHGAAAEEAIRTALDGRGELVPGKHCRFCPAKAICPKLRGEVVEALASALPGKMTVGQLAQWLDRADRMEAFISEVRNVAHGAATLAAQLGAEGIPGWKLKPKRATRQWADEEVVMAIARKRKIKIWQDKLLSPAMAEKEHKNLPQELRDQIVAVSSGTNLVRMEAGEAPAVTVKRPEGELSKKDQLKANIALMQIRR